MTLIERDLKHIWHPCSQMKDYERFPPVEIKAAKGCYIELMNGQRLLDAFSSWWCKSLGHNHPRLKQALIKQAEQYEHVVGVNTCQTPLVELSERLAQLTPNLDKVFYACDGSSAVEIALKMSLHAQKIQGQPQKNKIAALQNDFHGETVLTMSASDVGMYRDPYVDWLLPFTFLGPIPYVSSKDDPIWHDCSAAWNKIEAQLELEKETLTAVIVEPLVQGATGMQLYSADLLKRLRTWTQQNNVHLIADEIMTGLGRTGTALACEHAQIFPDFICLSKSLTSGWLPMSVVLTSSEIYDLFYDDYEKGKIFIHSHTFGGNALAASVAVETLTVLEEENIYQRVQAQQSLFYSLMQKTAVETNRLHNIRHIGAMVAADLIVESDRKNLRMGYEVYLQAVKLGALLRPLGNTIYWMPPLNITPEELNHLQSITASAIRLAFA